MARIAATAEDAVSGHGWDHMDGETTSIQIAVSSAVCDIASALNLAAIVPVTQTGATALAVARHRPDAPIVAATMSADIARRLALVWGVRSILVPFADDTDAMMDEVVAALLQSGAVQAGQRVAITAGRAQRVVGSTDFVLVRQV
jgi:pyruvate kinase